MPDEFEALGAVYKKNKINSPDPFLELGAKYINQSEKVKKEKTDDYPMGSQFDKFRDAFSQSLANGLIGTADLLPGVNIKPINDWSDNKGIAGKSGEIAGSLLGLGKLSKSINAIKKIPQLAKSIGANSLFGAISNPDNQAEGAGIGGLFGAGGHLLGKAMGTQNPYVKAGLGALVGSGTGAYLGGKQGAEAGGVIGAGASLYPGAGNRGIAKLLKMIHPDEIKNTMQNARDLNVIPRPTEVTGRPDLATFEGKALATEKGQQELYKSGIARQKNEKMAINDLLKDISKNPSETSRETRQAARSIISKQKDIRKQKSEPLYEASRGDIIPQAEFNTILKDPYLKQIYKEVKGNNLNFDKINQHPVNSVNMLDLMKKKIDTKIDSAKRGINPSNESIKDLMDQKNKIIDITDNVSHKYAQARKVYSEESLPIKDLENSSIGTLSKLKDLQLKNVSKIIFDNNKTAPHEFSQIKDKIYKENPDLWRKILRNHIEERISSSKNGVATHFYKKVLQNEKSFNQIMTASEDMPEIQNKLVKMKDVFSKLIDPISPKMIRDQSRVSTDKGGITGIVKKSAEFVDSLINGKYDKELLNLLTNPKWDKEFDRISKLKDAQIRTEKLGELMGSIGNASLNK